MTVFLRKLAIFVVLIVIVDRAAYPLIVDFVHAYRYDNRLADVSISSPFDVVILGSSRAARNIIPEIIFGETGLSTYNLGMPGSNIYYHRAVFQWIVQKGISPKALLLTLDPTIFVVDTSLVERTDKLAAYADDDHFYSFLVQHKVLTPAVGYVLLNYRLKMNFPEALFETQKPGALDTIHQNGSMWLRGQSERFSREKYSVDIEKNDKKELESKISSFVDILNLAKRNGIIVVLCNTPVYGKKNELLVERVKQYVDDNTILISDYDVERFSRDELFYDYGHLNYQGAKLYSEVLSSVLKGKVKHSGHDRTMYGNK